MGWILVLEDPDARAAGGTETVTGHMEPTTTIIVLINQKQQSVLNPVTFNYHSVATHFYLHLTFRLSQRLSKMMESVFQMNQFWERAQADLTVTDDLRMITSVPVLQLKLKHGQTQLYQHLFWSMFH